MKHNNFLLITILVILTGCTSVPSYKGTSEGLIALATEGVYAGGKYSADYRSVQSKVIVVNEQSKEVTRIKVPFKLGERVVFSKPILEGKYTVSKIIVDRSYYGEPQSFSIDVNKSFLINSGGITLLPFEVVLSKGYLSSSWISDLSGFALDDSVELLERKADGKGWRYFDQ